MDRFLLAHDEVEVPFFRISARFARSTVNVLTMQNEYLFE